MLPVPHLLGLKPPIIVKTPMRRPGAKWLLLVPPLLLGLAHLDLTAQRAPGDWRTASREPVGLAPNPATTAEAVVQVYAARTVRWRGYFGVHTWIAAKPAGAPEYAVYEVTSWRLRRADTAISISNRAPDARWFGNLPEVLAEIRGPEAAAAIARIEEAVAAYPYDDVYRIWPGPNSNTFTAYVLRTVPELRVDLPPTAIGKDYLGRRVIARAPDGVIEAIVDTRPDRFVLGVQWHPEIGWERDKFSQAIFKRFIEAAQKYRSR